MSNKILILVIVVLSLITIGVASLTQLNKSPGKVAMNSSQSSEIVSSVESQVSSSLVQVQSQVSLPSVVSSAEKVVESVKDESQTVIPNTNNPKVTYLDSKNPPQYIKDYLVCQKNPNAIYGLFVSEEDIIKFKCPPEEKCQEPKQGWRYNYETFKFKCMFGFDSNSSCLFFISIRTKENLQYKKIMDKISSDSGLLSKNQQCILFIREDLSESEIEAIRSQYSWNINLILYKVNN
jgi:hypothetical protein